MFGMRRGKFGAGMAPFITLGGMIYLFVWPMLQWVWRLV